MLAQRERDLELIVIDDGPDDQTARLLATVEDPRLIHLRRATRGGVSSARNLGLSRARGRYIAFQDSDDEWLADRLPLQLAALEAHPEAVMAVCGFLVPNWLATSQLGVDDPAPVVDITAMVPLRVPGCQCWLLRREVLASTGGFDPRIDCFEDWELALRLSTQGRVLMVNQPLVIKPWTEGSLFADQHFARNLTQILDWHRPRLSADPVVWRFYCNLIGQSLAQHGEPAAARRWFLQALAHGPLRPRAWGNLLMSLFGSAVFRRYVALARRLRARHAPPLRPPVHRGPPG